MNHYVIKMAHVESVEDDADGLRIKARLSQDGRQDINDLPYALGFMDSNAYLNTSIITNFGTLEELYQKITDANTKNID